MDDKKISDTTFMAIGRQYAKDMGFEHSQYIIYRHLDREHQHIHLIANRVGLNGEVVSDKWDYKRSENCVRELEKEFNLIQVKPSNTVMEKSMTKEEVGLYKRKHIVPVRKQLQIIAKDALQKATSLEEFGKLIVKSGAELQLHRNQKGNLYGASFQLDNVSFKASGLGKGYSINKILKQIEINNERNRGISEKTSNGKNQIVGWPGGTHYENQPGEYSTNERSAITNNNRNQQSSNDIKIGSTDSNRTTGQSGYSQSDLNQPSGRLERQDSTDETAQPRVQLQDLFDGNIGGGISGGSSSNSNDEDEMKRRSLQKKRQRKKQGPSL